MFWVRMHDNSMTGRADTQGKGNLLVIECETLAQARQIEEAATRRPEMRRIAIVSSRPKPRPGVLITRKKFIDLGGPWQRLAR
jgi:hypothetical protein